MIKKSAIVIGIGRFGYNIAIKLIKYGYEVLAVDINEKRINNICNLVTNVQIGDARDENFIKSLNIKQFDICIVSIKKKLQSSLEITSLLNIYNAKFILSRIKKDIHAKYFFCNCVNKIIYPEKEIAEYIVVKILNNNIYENIELANNCSICKIPVPKQWIKKKISINRIIQKYNIHILVVKRNNTIYIKNKDEYLFYGNEILIVIGNYIDIIKLFYIKE